jgi:hypothetical protein
MTRRRSLGPPATFEEIEAALADQADFSPPASLSRSITRLPRTKPSRGQGWARIDAALFADCGRWWAPSLALFLELRRLTGTRTVQRHDGWMVLSVETLRRLGLGDRWVRQRAARQGVKMGWLEVRRSDGISSKYAYRLRPGADASVVDLAAARNRRKGGAL